MKIPVKKNQEYIVDIIDNAVEDFKEKEYVIK